MPPVLQDAVKLSGSLKRTTRGCKPCKHERPSVHRFNAHRAAVAGLRGVRPSLRFTGSAPLQRGKPLYPKSPPVPLGRYSFIRVESPSSIQNSPPPKARGNGLRRCRAVWVAKGYPNQPCHVPSQKLETPRTASTLYQTGGLHTVLC